MKPEGMVWPVNLAINDIYKDIQRLYYRELCHNDYNVIVNRGKLYDISITDFFKLCQFVVGESLNGV